MREIDNVFELPFVKNTMSYQDTEEFAKKISNYFQKGDCIAFFGEMGAGKTAFVRGLADGLGVKGEVSSPTFAIVNEYVGPVPLIHFDMYRVLGEDDLVTTNFFEYLNGDNIVAIEWSENIIDFLPSDFIKVDIKKLGENTRQIEICRGFE